MLSERGQALASAPSMPAYLVEHFARVEEPYDVATRPHGYVPLCIAENRLVWDLIEPMVNRDRGVPAAALGYDDMVGGSGFREALASFLSRWVLGRPVGAEQVQALAGAGCILETLFYLLCDPGDGVLVPTPSYAGFWMDLEGRDALNIVPVHGDADDGFRVTPGRLDAAIDRAGIPVRALLFTSPNNPLGTVYSPDELEQILSWAESRDIHVVFDEVYALSVHGDRSFVSTATLRDCLGDKVHIVWAFSKDFAASGLRCGVLVSENEDVQKAISALSYWHCVSGDTQHMLQQWVSDEVWLRDYTIGMQDRLRRAYEVATARLDEAGVPYLPADAGFFVLVDLRAWLPEASWAGEEQLWRRLLDETNVNLTPGAAMRGEAPGLFRLCFASVPTEVLAVAVDRVAGALRLPCQTSSSVMTRS